MTVSEIVAAPSVTHGEFLRLLTGIRRDVVMDYTEGYAQKILDAVKPYTPVPGTNAVLACQVCDYFFGNTGDPTSITKFATNHRGSIRPFGKYMYMSIKEVIGMYVVRRMQVPASLHSMAKNTPRPLYSPKDVLMMAILWREKSPVANSICDLLVYNHKNPENRLTPEELLHSTAPQVFRATMIQVESTITPPTTAAVNEVPASVRVPSSIVTAEDNVATPQAAQEPGTELILSKILTLLEKIEKKGITISLAA